MKSEKTFQPEYQALKSVRNVFYNDEREYESVERGGKPGPFQQAIDFGRGLVEGEKRRDAANPAPPTDLVNELLMVLTYWFGRDRERTIRLLEEIAGQQFGNVADHLDFADRIQNIVRGVGQGSRDKQLEQLLRGWWTNFRGVNVDDAASHGARELLLGIEEKLGLIQAPPEIGAEGSVFDPLPEEDSDKEWTVPDSNYVITRRLNSLYGRGQSSTESLVNAVWEITGVDVEDIIESGRVRGHTEHRVGKPAFEAELGTDAFGLYLPFHAYAFSRKTPWGIYIFLEPLISWTVSVWLANSRKYPAGDIFTLLFLTVYRHELFHYHVERYAFMLEVAGRKAHYRPYIENVRKAVRNTEKWIEEALAQSVVLNSSLVKNRTGLGWARAKSVLTTEFKKLGAGYKDFDCAWTGGVAKAHRRLGTQVARGSDVSTEDEWTTDLMIPKEQYSRDPRSVPGYFAFSATIRSQFQFQTPRTKDVERFLKKRGGSMDVSTGSSHRNCTVDGKTFQMVDRHGCVDLNSFKKMAKAISLSAFDLKQEIARA